MQGLRGRFIFSCKWFIDVYALSWWRVFVSRKHIGQFLLRKRGILRFERWSLHAMSGELDLTRRQHIDRKLHMQQWVH